MRTSILAIENLQLRTLELEKARWVRTGSVDLRQNSYSLPTTGTKSISPNVYLRNPQVCELEARARVYKESTGSLMAGEAQGPRGGDSVEIHHQEAGGQCHVRTAELVVKESETYIRRTGWHCWRRGFPVVPTVSGRVSTLAHPRGGAPSGRRARRTGGGRTCRAFLARYYALGSKQRNKSIR